MLFELLELISLSEIPLSLLLTPELLGSPAEETGRAPVPNVERETEWRLTLKSNSILS